MSLVPFNYNYSKILTYKYRRGNEVMNKGAGAG